MHSQAQNQWEKASIIDSSFMCRIYYDLTSSKFPTNSLAFKLILQTLDDIQKASSRKFMCGGWRTPAGMAESDLGY